jgi:hypothetical protein
VCVAASRKAVWGSPALRILWAGLTCAERQTSAGIICGSREGRLFHSVFVVRHLVARQERLVSPGREETCLDSLSPVRGSLMSD